MRKIWLYFLALLFIVVCLVWYAFFQNSSDKLRIITCDVGQGDAILITYKSQQLIVDGGPGSKVLKCLSNHMPFWDREVEAMILTHPEKDHYGGLIDVFKSYSVKNFITTGLTSGGQDFQVLVKEVGSSTTKIISIKEGTIVRLGLIRFDVLWPSTSFLALESEPSKSNVLGALTTESKNDFSIVGILSFGNFDALLTGDIENEISDQIAEKIIQKNKNFIEYIKIPHHGSKNGLSEKLLDTANPEIAVISAGKNNAYGHPHKKVLDLLEKYKVRVLRTDLMGEIVVETDGNNYWVD